jgi:tetratricopeptide (TPR) repeat protein
VFSPAFDTPILVTNPLIREGASLRNNRTGRSVRLSLLLMGIVLCDPAFAQDGMGPAGLEAGPSIALDARAVAPGSPAAALAPMDERVAGTEEAADVSMVAPSPWRSEVERAWFEAGPGLTQRAEAARARALELGVENVEQAARVLIAAPAVEGDLSNPILAARLAPDLPIAHMALARAQLGEGEYKHAVLAAVAGIMAIPRNLEASAWVVGSLGVMFASVLIVSSLAFILAVGVSVFSDAAHDLGDLISRELPNFARAALILVLLLVPLAMGEGLMGLVIVLFAIGMTYGESRHRFALALAALLTVVAMYPVLQLSGKVLGALDADPIASAAFSAVRGSETPIEVERLRGAESRGDRLAASVMAVRARRSGNSEDALARYSRLLDGQVADALVLTTLGNLAFEDGRADDAIVFYERASAIDVSAILMFNLSQSYARAFRMEEFESTMVRAQALDSSMVDELSSRGDTDFVADLPFDIAPIRDRMLMAADGSAFSRSVISLLTPGLLGESWGNTLGGFGLAALLSVFVAGRYQHASGCGRCGRRICARCDDSMWSTDLCDGCHHLFNRPQGTDPTLRMARLKALRDREERVQKIYGVISVAIPGAAGLLAKRPDLGLLGMLLFAWAVALFVWRNGVVADPIAIGGAGPVAFMVAGGVMALLYVGVMISGIAIRRSL